MRKSFCGFALILIKIEDATVQQRSVLVKPGGELDMFVGHGASSGRGCAERSRRC